MTARLPAHLYRGVREQQVHDSLIGSKLVMAVNDQLEDLRASLAASLELPVPVRYASTSVDNTTRLLGDIRTLATNLVLKSKGLTKESWEFGEDGEDEREIH